MTDNMEETTMVVILKDELKYLPQPDASNPPLTPSVSLLNVQDKSVELDFSGGTLTSDAGVLLLREVEEQIGLIQAMVEVIPDPRDARYVKHTLTDLLIQRIAQIACGYEDANDCNDLRNDPVFKMRRALLGTWKAVDRQVNGKPITKGPVTRLIVTPGTLTLREKTSLVVSYTVDPTTTPNRITLIPRKHGVGQLLNGVFSLDGDTLTLCLNPKLNGPAPDSLESVEGDGYLLLKLQRAE